VRLAACGVAGLCLAHLVANVIWLTVDTSPPFFDMAGHALATQRILALPFTSDPRAAIDGLLHPSLYPPFVYWLAAAVAALTRPSSDVMCGVITGFFCLLIVCTYAVTRRFSRPRTGLLAAFLISMYPIVYGLSRYYLLDVPLTAMTALAVWLLLRTERFSRLGASCWLGIVIGLGMLTKWTYPLYVAGPLIMVLAATLRTGTRREARNVAVAAALAAALAAPWYLTSIPELKRQLVLNRLYAAVQQNPSAASLDGWLYYARYVVREQIFLPLAVLWAVSVVILLRRRPRDPATHVLMAWTAVTYVAMSLITVKTSRYTMPFLPAGAAMTAIAVDGLRREWLRRSLIAAIVAWSLVEWAGLSWGLGASDRGPPRLALFGKEDLTYYCEIAHIATPAARQDWRIADILRDARGPSRFGPPGSPIRLTVIPNAARFETNVFQYQAGLENRPLIARFVASVELIPDAVEQLRNSDYVVTKTGFQGAGYGGQVPTCNALLRDPTSDVGRQFELIGTYPLPDQSRAELYRHR
jgi:hypothetical protein